MRLGCALRVAPEGLRIVLATAAAGLVLTALGAPWAGLGLVLLALPAGAFFRDPDRFPDAPEDAVLSAADGRVTGVTEGRLPGFLEERWRRVSVFMSPLNVHVNRAPVEGEVILLDYTPGEFGAAFRDHASEHNERNLIVIRDPAGRLHAIRQIAGYVARRIVCRVAIHDRLSRGQRVGMIMFGSRVDHLIPLEYRVIVKVGDRVRAGRTVLGELAG